MPDDPALIAALESSQHLGMLGSRPIPEVIAHAEAFVAALAHTTGRVVDLGTGGGVPGLVVAARRPDLSLVLVDRRATRTDHVERLVRRLGWSDRVEVVTADVAALRRGGPAFDAAIARGFGPPNVTLAAGARLVRVDGLIVISEPPVGAPDRWASLDTSALGVTLQPSTDPKVVVFRRHGV
ncbi:MAG: RsmG family class I SAM-dependent methyltransferase [Desertimonas sp.]